jgi:hypothetical protein
MKYKRQFKVQFLGINGWFDLKSSSDGEKYKTDLYDTKEEALIDADPDMGPFHTLEYRIVPKSTKADWSIYC